jgi:hypothetical protein
MFELLAACVVMFAGCGAKAPATRPATALEFAKPPIVLYDPEQRHMYVWARLSRPLRHNVGYPAEDAGQPARFVVPFTPRKPSHVEYDPQYPTCYFEELHFAKPAPVLTDGQPLEVSLAVNSSRKLTTTGTVEVTDLLDSHPDQELGCVRAKDTRVCGQSVMGKRVSLVVSIATRTKCAVARDVFRSVGDWADPKCSRDLCARRHRSNRGFRCDSGSLGGNRVHHHWEVVCTKGGAEVRAWAED